MQAPTTTPTPALLPALNEPAALALWAACLAQLKQTLSATAYELWLAPIYATQLEQGEDTHVLWCVCPQKGKINSVLGQYQADIESIASQIYGQTIEWVLTEAVETTSIALAEDIDPENTEVNGDSSKAFSQTDEFTHSILHASALQDINHSGLSSRLVFEHFVVGKANQLAHAAAQHLAEQPGTAYNPFFLYGGVGLGKTHLIHAIGNQILKNKPSAKIRYIHANQFVADVVGSYRRQTFDAFKQYYHSLDVLLIDDVQFFANKTRTQEEFFYAFETLVANRSQIILTSDSYPKDLVDFEARLISRFSAGLTTAIEPPELEMRVAILHEKAKSMHIVLDEDVAFYIAKNLRSNIRELEGALHKLVAYSRFQASHITLELAKVALRDIIVRPKNILSIENIQKIVADYYKIKLTDLYGKRRLAGFVLPRQVAMYLAKELTQKSLPDIGESFGGRDHTTVLHAVRKIAQERLNNPTLNHQIHVLEQTLRS